MTPLKFFMFYGVFFGFVVYFSTLAGLQILQNANISLMIPKSQLDFINPLFIVGAMWSLFNISSEYQILYSMIIVPFILGLVYIMASWVRGVSP